MSSRFLDNEMDPLGLKQLGRIIHEARQGAGEIEPVAEAYQRVLASYRTLTDRYQLMKSSAKQLAEEVAWLRDQCDDFAIERNELLDELTSKGRDSRPPRNSQRLEDRS